MANNEIFNVNVGIMGHVDSGKTSLSKCMSDIASTAAFDKHPQSIERGITIDLGFSSFTCDYSLDIENQKFSKLQITLVDCPGHASLIKTVIGGSKIIDSVFLVIDVIHGIQVQTAECIVLAEIFQFPVFVILNKVDLIPHSDREESIRKEISKIKKVLCKTKLNLIKIIPVTVLDDEKLSTYSILSLKKAIIADIPIPNRNLSAGFLFAIDHCFQLKGQGTILTGTVIEGSTKVGDDIYIINHDIKKEIKSIQMFKKPVTRINVGDRAGIAVNKFNPDSLERGLACSLCFKFDKVDKIMCKINRIPYFKRGIKSFTKLNVSVGYEISTATILFFDYHPSLNEFEFIDEIDTHEERFCLLRFEKPVLVSRDSKVIGLNLSQDLKKNVCRIMFHGIILPKTNFDLNALKLFSYKERKGQVDKFLSEIVIVKNMFTNKSNIEKYFGKDVEFSTGDRGKIISKFGESGRVKVEINGSISQNLKNKQNNKELEINVTCMFKKYRKINF